MDIFSGDAGTVILAEVRNGTPMTLFVDGWHGHTEIDEVTGETRLVRDERGGFHTFRSIITGFKVQLKGGVQFLHTLNDFIYVYTFGERMGQVTISGISFYQDCKKLEEVIEEPEEDLEQSMFDVDLDENGDPILPPPRPQARGQELVQQGAVQFGLQGEVKSGAADHGLEEVIGYYGLNRVNFRPTPVTIVLGTTTAFECFLTELHADLADTDRLVGNWNMQFAAIPG
jgi:hypothetical protein